MELEANRDGAEGGSGCPVEVSSLARLCDRASFSLDFCQGRVVSPSWKYYCVDEWGKVILAVLVQFLRGLSFQQWMIVVRCASAKSVIRWTAKFKPWKSCRTVESLV